MLNKSNKKLTIILILVILSFLIIGLVLSIKRNKVIGYVYGSEHEYISIGEETFTQCNNPGVQTASARNRRLGVVRFKSDSREKMKVWSVKGYDDLEYIYTVWVYDGAYYRKDS